MHNKDTLHKKYLNHKRFSINKVPHEIFKSLLRTSLLQALLHPGPKWHETNMEKKIKITNVNKRFTNFPTMIKHEKHIIDNRAKISENSNEFLCFSVKSLKIKFLYPLKSPWECYHSKWETSEGWKMISSTRNHEDFFNH